jgi:hypothetical protein
MHFEFSPSCAPKPQKRVPRAVHGPADEVRWPLLTTWIAASSAESVGREVTAEGCCSCETAGDEKGLW